VVERLQEGFTFVVDADLRSYFDSIPADRLLEQVKDKISDSRVISLIEAYLNQDVMCGLESWSPERGTPQGAVISPLLSNIYLDPLDHLMEEQGYRMVRYADDFVILCRDRREADQALITVKSWVEGADLGLHPDKTVVVDATLAGGFDFLGYHFERGYLWPRSKSLRKFKEKIRSKTKRTNGHSLEVIIQGVNRSLTGWFHYFKHSHKTTFPRLDQWVRMRLRSILRRRAGGKGRGRGVDHHRWTNAFLADLGLFSLVTAHVKVCQSALERGTTDWRAVCGRTARTVRREG
jgi:RNA-directed DNA polymerase